MSRSIVLFESTFELAIMYIANVRVITKKKKKKKVGGVGWERKKCN